MESGLCVGTLRDWEGDLGKLFPWLLEAASLNYYVQSNFLIDSDSLCDSRFSHCVPSKE